MIDYGKFQFAAPVCTDSFWIMQVVHFLGIHPLPGPPGSEDLPFKKDDRDRLKVSIVRHPCTWLAALYACSWPWASQYASGELANLAICSFDEFVRKYLAKSPSGISEVFNRYESDVNLRYEDFPHCLFEFLESIGTRIPDTKQIPIIIPEGDCPQWDPNLYREVIRENREFCERYEY